MLSQYFNTHTSKVKGSSPTVPLLCGYGVCVLPLCCFASPVQKHSQASVIGACKLLTVYNSVMVMDWQLVQGATYTCAFCCLREPPNPPYLTLARINEQESRVITSCIYRLNNQQGASVHHNHEVSLYANTWEVIKREYAHPGFLTASVSVNGILKKTGTEQPLVWSTWSRE